jgi:hypothetical protein
MTTAKKRGLGRGLDALLGDVPLDAAESRSDEGLHQLPVDIIERGRYQPRVDMHPESLQNLGAGAPRNWRACTRSRPWCVTCRTALPLPWR